MRFPLTRGSVFGSRLVAEPSPLDPPGSLRTCVVAGVTAGVELSEVWPSRPAAWCCLATSSTIERATASFSSPCSSARLRRIASVVLAYSICSRCRCISRWCGWCCLCCCGCCGRWCRPGAFCIAAGVAADAASCEARALCSISVWMRPAAARNGRSRTRLCTAVFVSPSKPLQNCLSSVNIVSSFDRPGHTVSATRAIWMT